MKLTHFIALVLLVYVHGQAARPREVRVSEAIRDSTRIRTADYIRVVPLDTPTNIYTVDRSVLGSNNNFFARDHNFGAAIPNRRPQSRISASIDGYTDYHTRQYMTQMERAMGGTSNASRLRQQYFRFFATQRRNIQNQISREAQNQILRASPINPTGTNRLVGRQPYRRLQELPTGNLNIETKNIEPILQFNNPTKIDQGNFVLSEIIREGVLDSAMVYNLSIEKPNMRAATINESNKTKQGANFLRSLMQTLKYTDYGVGTHGVLEMSKSFAKARHSLPIPEDIKYRELIRDALASIRGNTRNKEYSAFEKVLQDHDKNLSTKKQDQKHSNFTRRRLQSNIPNVPNKLKPLGNLERLAGSDIEPITHSSINTQTHSSIHTQTADTISSNQNDIDSNSAVPSLNNRLAFEDPTLADAKKAADAVAIKLKHSLQTNQTPASLATGLVGTIVRQVPFFNDGPLDSNTTNHNTNIDDNINQSNATNSNSINHAAVPRGNFAYFVHQARQRNPRNN